MNESKIELFNKEINEEIRILDLDIKNGIDKAEIETRVSSIITKYANTSSEILSDEIIKKASDKVNAIHEEMADFFPKHEQRWGKAIDLLEIFWRLSIENGQTFSDEYYEIASKKGDLVFFTLKQLHGQACRVTAEIVTLLRNGYPDGAMARWCTLYEILVISDFIKKHGNETARRFLEFEEIEGYQAIGDYQKNAKKLKKQPFSEKELLDIEDRIRPLKEKYKERFYDRYGWTMPDLKLKGNQKPSFKKMVDQSGYSHYYPYYTWASYPIHSSPKSLTVVLGQPEYNKKGILAGPSDASGMAEPGMMTGITFLQINVNFLGLSKALPQLIKMKTMGGLEKRIVKDFFEAHQNPIP